MVKAQKINSGKKKAGGLNGMHMLIIKRKALFYLPKKT
jgi:hypothetical protein